MRLRNQISLSLATFALLMGAFMMVYFPVQQEAAALQSLEQEAVTSSAIIARSAEAALDFYSIDPEGGTAELQAVLQIAGENSDVVYVQVFDQDGEVLPIRVGDLANVIKFADRYTQQTAIDSRLFHVVMPVRVTKLNTVAGYSAAAGESRGELVGAIQMGFSLERMLQQIRHDRNVTVGVVLAMLLCAILVAYLLSDLLLRPLDALKQVVYAFGQGNQNVRAKAGGSQEISQLGAVFNQMADALEESSKAERKRANELARANRERNELETRYRRAFDIAPIGMGLLDIDGMLFNTNPALREMLWPDSGAPPQFRFAEMLDGDDLDRFTSQYKKLISGELDSLDENLSCRNAAGEIIQTLVSLSTVRCEMNNFLYAVLQVQDVTESQKLADQLEYQARNDELTGLLNRRSFEVELGRAWEQGNTGKKKSYLLFMDLDQFKVVNDTSGHAAGDQLLKNVSEILLDKVRDNDTVCRLGGDEFGIILWRCPTDVAKNIAESIRAGIESLRFHWETETYHIGISIGGLAIDPAVGDTAEVQQLADAACYAAKEEGRNRVHLVAGEKDSARVRRGQVRWVQRLREAMDRNHFAIYGQMIKPLAEDADEPERLEILLRLRNPVTRKLIPPGAFLPAAERYGMSVELDQWVVQSLLDKLFIHQSFQAEHRKYWINLSATSIGDQRFAKFLTDAIEHSPLPPGTVNFEITETSVIRSVVEAGKLMSALREMGCQFAMDDFGSGLSSFEYLKKLPVDYLKIDGKIVRNILSDETNRIFVKSIIDIARALGIKTIAEFVETDELLEMVRDLGADYAQGFSIHRPFELAPRFPQSVSVPAPANARQKAV